MLLQRKNLSSRKECGSVRLNIVHRVRAHKLTPSDHKRKTRIDDWMVRKRKKYLAYSQTDIHAVSIPEIRGTPDQPPKLTQNAPQGFR